MQVCSKASVLTQHNNGERTGANLDEFILTPSNVNVKQFGMLFRRMVDDQVYGQPLVVANVGVRGGTHDLVFVTTVNNSVYAFDANDPYASEPFWHVNFGTPPNAYDGKYGCSDMRRQRLYAAAARPGSCDRRRPRNQSGDDYRTRI
jgi:glucose dehydrogenase